MTRGDDPTTRPIGDAGLKKDAISASGIVFLVLAAASPLIGLTGAVPSAMVVGNGLGVTLAYIVVGLILLLFAVGYAAMAHQVTNAGALYAYIGRGLGTTVGIGAASIAVWAYTVVQIAIYAFFGVVATCGSAYVQLERVPLAAAAASLPVGLGAVAILLANNVRDIDGDRLAGKRTLAVRLGRDRSRDLFTAVVAAIFACAALLGLARPPVLLTLAALPLALTPVRLVRTRSDGPGLIAALGATARLQLAVSVLLAAGLWRS